MQLVLSLFPGIGLLDAAFELEGFCVVRGPDVLWGGDIRRFHPPAGRFDVVIGGPPCQEWSRFRRLNKKPGRYGNLIPEFSRCVEESQPQAFVMENVPDAPVPNVSGYIVRDTMVNNRWCPDGPFGAEQERVRRISFGTRGGVPLLIEFAALEASLHERAVTADARRVSVKLNGLGVIKRSLKPPTVTASDTPGPGRRGKGNYLTWQEKAVLQGLPSDFDLPPFRVDAKHEAIGNGVPLPMGRAIAKAVRNALNDKGVVA